ncbi:MAG: ComEA family DNA-binding protein [Flavobacteriales bacterium]
MSKAIQHIIERLRFRVAMGNYSRSFAVLCCFLLIGIATQAQSKREREAANKALIEERIEILNENLDENADVDLTALFDAFNQLIEKPLNINSASEEELRALFFLTEIQIQSIIDHREKYGVFISIYELRQVKFLEKEGIYFMLPFVVVDEVQAVPRQGMLSLLEGGRNELWMRYQRLFQDQKGFLPNADGEVPFNGSPDRLYFRYRYSNGNKLSLGVTGEKDAGETFFSGNNQSGFDFYSAHLFYRNPNRSGFIKRIALGDYHAKFGQGLVTWSGFAFGKSVDVNSVKRPTIGLKANTSADENLFLRGGAVTFGPEKLDVTVFYSRKRIDGNIAEANDTLQLDVQEFTSIQNIGLHRTDAEIADKDAVLEEQIGVNVTTLIKGWRLGFNGVRTSYDLDLNRRLGLYNQFEFSDQQNTAYSIDYGKVWKNVNLFGEAARSANGGRALVSGLLASLNKQISLSMLYRNYSRDFHSVLNNGFGETGGTRNERGLFTGLTYKPNRKIKVTGYADHFKFPWLRFRTDAPSSGVEYLAQINYKPKRTQEFYIRYRTESKVRNATGSDAIITAPVDINLRSLRLHAAFKPTGALQFKTRAEFSQFSEVGRPLERGFLIYQDVSYKPIGKPYQLSLRYAHFSMDSYNARIYAYESDLLYVFSVPPYFGRGSRIYAMAKFKIKRRVDLWVRWSQWFYTDRSTISSGNNEILTNIRDEIKVQMRWRF